MAKNDRFQLLLKENGLNPIKVYVDTQTGVQYLFIVNGYAGGLTPLLDENGHVVVDKSKIKK